MYFTVINFFLLVRLFLASQNKNLQILHYKLWCDLFFQPRVYFIVDCKKAVKGRRVSQLTTTIWCKKFASPHHSEQTLQTAPQWRNHMHLPVHLQLHPCRQQCVQAEIHWSCETASEHWSCISWGCQPAPGQCAGTSSGRSTWCLVGERGTGKTAVTTSICLTYIMRLVVYMYVLLLGWCNYSQRIGMPPHCLSSSVQLQANTDILVRIRLF